MLCGGAAHDGAGRASHRRPLANSVAGQALLSGLEEVLRARFVSSMRTKKGASYFVDE